jgi:hypothetical protein
MARGSGNRGNAGSRGGGTRGRTFKVLGRKKRPVGRPRKTRRPLSAGFIGVPPELRQAREPEPVDDIEEEVSGATEAPDKE